MITPLRALVCAEPFAVLSLRPEGPSVAPACPAGTLTLNKMEIQEYCPTFKDGETLQTVLISAALAAKWKEVRAFRVVPDGVGRAGQHWGLE